MYGFVNDMPVSCYLFTGVSSAVAVQLPLGATLKTWQTCLRKYLAKEAKVVAVRPWKVLVALVNDGLWPAGVTVTFIWGRPPHIITFSCAERSRVFIMIISFERLQARKVLDDSVEQVRPKMSRDAAAKVVISLAYLQGMSIQASFAELTCVETIPMEHSLTWILFGWERKALGGDCAGLLPSKARMQEHLVIAGAWHEVEMLMRNQQGIVLSKCICEMLLQVVESEGSFKGHQEWWHHLNRRAGTWSKIDGVAAKTCMRDLISEPACGLVQAQRA